MPLKGGPKTGSKWALGLYGVPWIKDFSARSVRAFCFQGDLAEMFPSGFYKVCCKGDTGVWGFLGLWGLGALRAQRASGLRVLCFQGPRLSFGK